MRRLYVRLIRFVTPAFRAVGLLALWERAPQSRPARWARSLFAIYDVDEMVRLDLAWWNFAASDRVEALLATHPGARVFEFGSGASTVWLCKRGAKVISVEHDSDWAEIVRSRIPEGVTLTLVGPDSTFDAAYASGKNGSTDLSFRAYASSIDAQLEQFDLIIIDGRARTQCLTHALPRLAPGGTILFDDSGRSRYRSAISTSGLVERRFRGLSACTPYPDSTSLLTAGLGTAT